jgi:hypothetical protein
VGPHTSQEKDKARKKLNQTTSQEKKESVEIK